MDNIIVGFAVPLLNATIESENKVEVDCDFVDDFVVIVFVVVVGFIVVVVVVTDSVIFIEDVVKFPTVVEFMFRTTVTTNTFVIIFHGFVCAITVVGEVVGDVPVLVEDYRVRNVAGEISSVVRKSVVC